MKKYLWTWALCMGTLASIYGLIFAFTPLSTIVPGGYLWISLGALAVYFCEGANIKLFPNYTASTAAGLAWGYIGIMAIGMMIVSGVSEVAAICIVLFIVTFLVAGVHLIALEKTWFNKPAMVFATIAFILSQGGQNIVFIGLAILGGFVLGVGISLTGEILGKKMLPSDK